MQKIGMNEISCEEYSAALECEPKKDVNGMPLSFYRITKEEWLSNE